MIKILFYIESLHSGGKERRLVELIKGLSKYHDIEMELVLTKEGIHYTDIYNTGVRIHYTIRKGIKKDPRLFWSFYKIARKFKPDIIHVWGNMAAIYSIPTKIALKIPIINNQISDAPISYRFNFFNNISFYFSNRIVANTKAGISAYRISNTKALCIYNGFDFSRLNKLKKINSIKTEFNIKTRYLVAMVATFSYYKDYDSYIKAAINICRIREDVTFISVGNGDNIVYKEMVPDNLKNRILFFESQTDIESIMNVCDIGVLASFTEGISNTLLEFMALGKPVIATGEGGTKELINDGINGIHIPAKRHPLLSEKIQILIEDEETRQFLGKNARKTIIEKFEIKLMIDSFIEEYKRLLTY